MARLLLVVSIGMLAFLVFLVSQLEPTPSTAPTAADAPVSDAHTSAVGVQQPTVEPPSSAPQLADVQPVPAQRSVTVAHGDILSPADGNCYVKVFEHDEPVTGFGTGEYRLVTVAGSETEIQQRILEIQQGAAKHARSQGRAGCSIIG